MYATPRLFAIRRQVRRSVVLIAGAGACALLSGCVANPFRDAQVDPNSPVAAEVARVTRIKTDYPTFAQIPAAPKDVRPARQYGLAADQIEQARVELERQTAPETWSLKDTESFAARARSAAGNEAPPSRSSDATAFANSQRKRATPPPPPPK